MPRTKKGGDRDPDADELFSRINDSDVEGVRTILNRKPELVNALHSRDEITTLMKAAEVGSVPVFEALLSFNPDLSKRSGRGQTIREHLDEVIAEFEQNDLSTEDLTQMKNMVAQRLGGRRRTRRNRRSRTQKRNRRH